MNLLEQANVQQGQGFRLYLNTGTLLDFATGSLERGVGDHWYMNGGVNWMPAVIGRPQRYKSTVVNMLIARILERYPDSVAITLDTEENGASSPEYFNRFTNTDISNRVVTYTVVDHDMDSFFEEFKRIADDKAKHINDYKIELPFINPRTGKPRIGIIPTIFSVDSLSRLASTREEEDAKKYDISNSKLNMSDMVDGRKKSRMLKLMPMYCARYGINVFFTGHIGNDNNPDPYSPKIRDLDFLGNNDKVKNVSSQFNAAVTMQLMNNALTKLFDKNNKKESLYPLEGFSDPTELQRVETLISRSKGGTGSGTVVPWVISQPQGYLHGTTMYDYLRCNKYAGLQGGQVNNRLPLLPDVSLKRQNIREKTRDNYELERALEIASQYEFIRNNWPKPSYPESTGPFTKTTEELCEEIVKSEKVVVSDVLNSRGYWTYGKNDREYLSIFDIVERLGL